jgi:hypothetical protein
MAFTSGSYNSSLGMQALYATTTGNYNTASGYEALYENTSGQQNTANGVYALHNNKVGSYNTALGVDALYGNGSGESNIGIGYKAGYNITAGSNNIDIGTLGVAGDSAVTRIGTVGGGVSTQAAAYIAGDFAALSGGTIQPLYVDYKSGQIGISVSSERFKTGIEPMGASTGKLEQLRPVTFKYKSAPDGARQYGLIAEEVAKVYPELVVRDAKGQILTVRYDELAPMLLNEMNVKLAKQDGEIAAQNRQIADQTKRYIRVSGILGSVNLGRLRFRASAGADPRAQFNVA